MANDKYNIEIELKAQLDEATKAIETLKQIEKASGDLSKSISSTATIVNGFYMELGGDEIGRAHV